ncbi:hypothetical protein CGLO_08035 [Colletotrichum gloeosporioides Cg-14]|uniref:Uncharacterized protein n=1 Tax=Colletotrichum gloeosporioides (strain Cg-14) TaxID=1237896 RepID=T0LL04_COLGC|nr:hypothetical protein CGLO_08035 [Colletotrichum gloeosporioides Cg-14]
MSLPELVSIMDKRSKKRPAWSFREKFKSFFSKKTMSSSQHEVHLESDDGKASSNDKAEPEGEAPALAHHYDGDNSAPATQQDEDTPISNSKTDRHGKLASEIWEAAFEEVKADEKMNNFALFYEEQIKKVVDQENPRTPMDGESFEQIGKEQCLEIVGKTLKDVEKHQEAKDNAITVLTVVKGLSSFIGSMLSECPPAALAWAGICSCIPIITAPMEQDKDMMIGLQHICDRAPTDKDKRQIQEEISIVMDYRLGKLKEDFPDMSDEVVGILRTGLAENGSEQRTYLWMHLMFDYIRKNRFCTREEWREIFRNPPDTVDRTYEGLLQSVTPQAKERVRTLLALILAAKRPLTVAELSTAVNCRINTLESRKFDLDDIPDEKEFGSWIRWECGSFVTIYEGKAFLIHQTAKEFLLEAPEADHGGWQGSMTKHVIHQYMAESCISFLSLEKFQQQEHADYVQTKISSLGEDATMAILKLVAKLKVYVLKLLWFIQQ